MLEFAQSGLASRRIGMVGELNGLRASGEEFPLEAALSQCTVQKKQLLTLILRDSSERRRAEDERLKFLSQIQQTQKLESLGVLAGGIAHDFNNLLMAVLGHADLALDALPASSEARDDLAEIRRAAQRAAELCKQMLAYSGKGRFVIQPVELQKVVEEMLHMLRVSISKNAILKLNFAPNLPERGRRCDAAAPGGHEPGHQRVGGDRRALGRHHAFDRRHGLRSAVLVRVVARRAAARRHVRVHRGRRHRRGHGRRDAHAHLRPVLHHQVHRPRAGARRRCWASCAATAARSRSTASSARARPSRCCFPASQRAEVREEGSPVRGIYEGKGTVLLVDDDESVRAVGRKMLERIGFTVVTAADGAEAIARFRERADDIICAIVDLTMPHVDGAETFRELRRMRPGRARHPVQRLQRAGRDPALRRQGPGRLHSEALPALHPGRGAEGSAGKDAGNKARPARALAAGAASGRLPAFAFPLL